MAILEANNIQLGAEAASKEDAIRMAGQLLVATGYVHPDYVSGMLAREETMSTYLGEGVSIPHGQFANHKHVLKTGISVLQIPAGVVWEDDEKAHLVIGIAATSDEHMGILTSLAEAIEDEDILQELLTTTDPQVILTHLTKEPETDKPFESVTRRCDS
jgi:phosphocarrier protein FPr